MATSGTSLAIAVGIYAVILALALLAFSKWRRTKLTRKFYAPKLHVHEEGHRRPPSLSETLGGWVPQVRRQGGAWGTQFAAALPLLSRAAGWQLGAPSFNAIADQAPCCVVWLGLQVLRMSEAEVIRCAGVDAAMYLKVLRCGESFSAAAAIQGLCPPVGPDQLSCHGRYCCRNCCAAGHP